MIGKYRFGKGDIAANIRDSYGFDGDLLDIFVNNTGPVVHKWHHYIPLYDRYFGAFRGTGFKFLEIGVAKGGSMQIWRKFFGDKATIFGIDIDPACAQFDGKAGQVRIGSQDDPAFLKAVVEEMGGVDAVLDDGSHHMDHVHKTLEILFPMLSAPGVYMIEDMHTAYWPDYGGGPEAAGNFFRTATGLMHDMHHWYHAAAPHHPATKGWVGGLHVHDSVVVLDKQDVARPVHSSVGAR
ncbi:class I SAM-dependent methyltransferase [Anianabacter salinae]|uniref:class I SAM-dependent methyltransferase n=1 Tax=Anianabacter salinae TaxID=2851023 RepID=UPI00225E3649|nr:class I SAM-dependent methyltransferase [Anianabacter salinae]MBV0912729.1 cephalosporin hydroxylase family protein [Anianabacter salinae]